MAFVRKEFIEKAMRTNGCRFFVIKEAGKLVASQQDNDVDIEESIELLNETLSNFTSGVVDVILSIKSNSEKSRGGKSPNFEYKVKIEGDTVTTGGNSLMMQVMDLQVKLMQMGEQRKYDELERKFEEFKKQKNGNKTDGLNKLAMALIPHLTGTKQLSPPLAGHDDDNENNNMTSDDKKLKLKAALQKLAKYDKNYIKHLELLAAFAESNTEKYLSFVPMLQAL